MNKILHLTAGMLCTLALNAQISNASLLVHYKLDGNSADSSGNNLHGMPYDITGTTDRFGNANSACYFNGTSSYIRVERDNIIEPKDSISITAWVLQEYKTNNGWYPIVSKRYSRFTDPFDSYGITAFNDSIWQNKWNFNVSSGQTGSLQLVRATQSNPFDQWMFIAATYNKSSLSIFVNGVLDSTISTSIGMAYSTMPLFIGFNGVGPDEYFKGKIDDVRIYGRVLSPAEITILSGKTTGISDAIGTDNMLNVYPNPASHAITVSSSHNFNHATIFDMYGRVVLMTAEQLTTIDISNLTAGNYVLKLSDPNGITATKRFTKN